jgi:hypothetical protein
LLFRKIHVTGQTLELLNGEYKFEGGTEIAKNEAFLLKNNITTYLISSTNSLSACEGIDVSNQF